jgi:hypothetical protein
LRRTLQTDSLPGFLSLPVERTLVLQKTNNQKNKSRQAIGKEKIKAAIVKDKHLGGKQKIVTSNQEEKLIIGDFHKVLKLSRKQL